MIHELPVPLRENTHVRIVKRSDAPSSGGTIWFRLGTMVGESFIPDSLIPEIRRPLPVTVLDSVRGRAGQGGAPMTNGEQEYRWADLLAVLDAEGWAP